MPNPVGVSRPPPAAVAARPTTTSRRGGRTRSRSPISVGNRMPDVSTMPAGPVSGEAPSNAAAAAAAAAAKALSGRPWQEETGAGDPNAPYQTGWPDNNSYGRARYQGGPYGGYSEDFRCGYNRSSPLGYQPDYRYRKQAGGARSPGGTSHVMGGPSPIHYPKPEGPQPHRGSASSVFRGRPNDTNRKKGGDDKKEKKADSPNIDDDDSPQKILLSLRTPTTSFEDKDKKKSPGSATLSPDDPPLIQQQRPPDQLFEPQRSPEAGIKNSGSIEMAPSFNLFNQSFDSFGDGHYFNVDAALQADSFGMARTDSAFQRTESEGILRKNSSGGNFGTFLASAGSGALTIGYSPVNSFGTATAAAQQPRRTGSNMMVLGGSDNRAASPTQVLGMYRSYSGTRPLDDSHMRMSAVGSFGGAGYQQSPYQLSPYHSMDPTRSLESGEQGPHFYKLLRKFRAAFKDCTFLLPGLKTALLQMEEQDTRSSPTTVEGEGQNWDPSGKPMVHHPYMSGEPTPQDTAVARRRIESSVCAFGGNMNRERTASQQTLNKESDKASDRSAIFRGKDATFDEQQDLSAAVTPSPTKSGGEIPASRPRSKYEEALPGRYYENESRLSWEFEETPPIEILNEVLEKEKKNKSNQGAVKTDPESSSKDGDKTSDGEEFCQPIGEGGSSAEDDERKDGGSSQSKMRYRCKLCGQPKQNHRCPYQQSLARSIGIMVYPAVNAFTADEPGTIAAPLTEMNNFVDGQKESSSNESSPSRPTPDRRRLSTVGTLTTSTQVTPESMRSRRSPPSSYSRSHRSRSKKRGYGEMKGDHRDLLFVQAMELKPEQFRIISQSKMPKTSEAYHYPALPLPYAQRKRLSDNLFSLSNEIPKLTNECAQVLREAREKDMWDLAVAELMTQVIVIIHCPERDFRLEGLRQYLLTLGIAA